MITAAGFAGYRFGSIFIIGQIYDKPAFAIQAFIFIIRHGATPELV
jgi:hypothetical protein